MNITLSMITMITMITMLTMLAMMITEMRMEMEIARSMNRGAVCDI
jgi:hypothetical protein